MYDGDIIYIKLTVIKTAFNTFLLVNEGGGGRVLQNNPKNNFYEVDRTD